MLKTLPWRANQVSLQPPLSHTRIGAMLLITLEGCSDIAHYGTMVVTIR